jgi:anti-sigma factor RsiW
MMMSDCEFRSRLDAFYDGELDAPNSEQFERHVESCPACAAELHEMQRVGRMFDDLAGEPMSDTALSRVHQAVDQVETDADAPLSLWRVSLVLTSLAASVVVIGSVWLREIGGPASGPVLNASAPSWERVATLRESGPIPQTPLEGIDRTRLADQRFTQFMLENLTPRGSHEKQ